MPRRSGTLLTLVAVAVAAVTSALLLVVPTGEYVRVSQTTTSTSYGATSQTSEPARVERGRTSLLDELDEEGYGILVALAIPAVLAALPLPLRGTRFARPARVAAAFLLFGFVFITGFSIGLFYVPTLVVALAAAVAR